MTLLVKYHRCSKLVDLHRPGKFTRDGPAAEIDRRPVFAHGEARTKR